jgi:hypothetical protein
MNSILSFDHEIPVSTQYDSRPEAGIGTRRRTGRIYISIQTLT